MFMYHINISSALCPQCLLYTNIALVHRGVAKILVGGLRLKVNIPIETAHSVVERALAGVWGRSSSEFQGRSPCWVLGGQSPPENFAQHAVSLAF